MKTESTKGLCIIRNEEVLGNFANNGWFTEVCRLIQFRTKCKIIIMKNVIFFGLDSSSWTIKTRVCFIIFTDAMS